MFVATVGEVFVFGPSSAFLDQLAPDHLRGTYFGAANFKRLGASLGPVIGGFLLDTGGGMLLFLTMTLVALASAGLQRHGESISRLPSHSPEHGKRSSGLGGAKTSRVGAA
jgi:MFS family permease